MKSEKINKSFLSNASNDSKGSRRKSKSPQTKKELFKKPTKSSLYEANDPKSILANFTDDRYSQIKSINDSSKPKSDLKNLLSKKQVNIMSFLPPDLGIVTRINEEKTKVEEIMDLQEEIEEFNETPSYSQGEWVEPTQEKKTLKQIKMENDNKRKSKRKEVPKESTKADKLTEPVVNDRFIIKQTTSNQEEIIKEQEDLQESKRNSVIYEARQSQECDNNDKTNSYINFDNLAEINETESVQENTTNKEFETNIQNDDKRYFEFEDDLKKDNTSYQQRNIEDELSAIIGDNKQISYVSEPNNHGNYDREYNSRVEEIEAMLLESSVYKPKINESDRRVDQFLEEVDELTNNNAKRISNVINDRSQSVEVVNLAIELKETKKSLKFLKDLMQKTRTEAKENEAQLEKKHEDKLLILKKTYQEELDHLYALKETLLIEKRQAAAEREELLNKVDCFERDRKKTVEHMVQNFELEIKKQREQWFQAEKMNRQKWESKKYEEIKAKVTKQLEPDVQMIIDSNKRQLEQMTRRMEDTLKEQREKISEEYERKIAILKDRLREEKDEGMSHERSKNSQKLNNQLELLEQEHAEERRRWNAQLANEAAKLQNLRDTDKKLFDESLRDQRSKHEMELEENKKYYNKRLADMEIRLKEQTDYEHRDSKLKDEKKMADFIATKEKEYEEAKALLKKELNAEMRKKIDIATNQLSEEATNLRKEERKKAEEAANERNKFLELENKQLKEKVVDLTEKLQRELKIRQMNELNTDELSARCRDAESDLEKTKRNLIEYKGKYEGVSDRLAQIEEEFNKEKQKAIDEINVEVDKLMERLKQNKEEIASMKKEEDRRMVVMKEKHELEMKRLATKVKEAINEKNKVIASLEYEVETQKVVIKKKEEMLEQQRIDLLG